MDPLIAGLRILAFGHLGDGNIHFNLAQPEHEDKENFLACTEAKRMIDPEDLMNPGKLM